MNLLYSLKMILRSWMRSPLSTAISLVSLTVGLACSTVLILYTLDQWRISKSLGSDRDTYAVQYFSYQNEDKANGVMTINGPWHVVPRLAERYPQIEARVLWGSESLSWGENGDKQVYSLPRTYAVTPEIMEMFRIPVEEGDLAATLAAPGQIAVTRKFASLYFGDDENPIGREVVAKSYERRWVNNAPIENPLIRMRISTILEDAESSPLAYSALYRLPADKNTAQPQQWYFRGAYGFIRLKAGSDPQEFLNRVAADSTLLARDSIQLLPIRQMYFSPEKANEIWGSLNRLVRTQDPQTLYIALAISFAVLLIACFNYINITMTRSARRLKNMAGQRIMGASKWSVRAQTLLDTTLQVALGFAIALVVIDSILPAFNTFMESRLAMNDLFAGANPWVLLGLLVLITVLSSVFVIVKLESSSVLLSFKAPSAGKMAFTRVMVVAQFVVSVVLVSVALNITRQINYLTHTVPNADRIMSISFSSVGGGTAAHNKEYYDRVKSLAFVEKTIPSDMQPGTQATFTTEKDGTKTTQMTYIGEVPADYFDFYDMPVVEGRAFNDNDGEEVVIVNRTYARLFHHVENPLGQKSGHGTIVGIVDDRIMSSARQQAVPMMFVHKRESDQGQFGDGSFRFNIKTTGPALDDVEKLQALWKELGNAPMPEFRTLAQEYREMNKNDDRLRQIVTFFAGLSILLTALGLFGLAWYAVERRKKEIALRKVHGSRVSQVIDLLCRSFFSWMAVAVIIALPVAWWLSAEWLKSFVYKAPIAWWTFAATALIAAAVTLLTVIFQSWRAATANPVKAIHAE